MDKVFVFIGLMYIFSNVLYSSELKTCKIIDDADDSFGFAFRSDKLEKVIPIGTYYSSISYHNFVNNTTKQVGFSYGGIPFTLKPNQLYVWCNPMMTDPRSAKLEYPFINMRWKIVDEDNCEDLGSSNMYLWDDTIYGDLKFASPTGVESMVIDCKIAKLLNHKPLSIALILTNNSNQDIQIPNFLSKQNGLYYTISSQNEIYLIPEAEFPVQVISPGKTAYIKVDLAELFKNNNISLADLPDNISTIYWRCSIPGIKDKIEIEFNLYKIPTIDYWQIKECGYVPENKLLFIQFRHPEDFSGIMYVTMPNGRKNDFDSLVLEKSDFVIWLGYIDNQELKLTLTTLDTQAYIGVQDIEINVKDIPRQRYDLKTKSWQKL